VSLELESRISNVPATSLSYIVCDRVYQMMCPAGSLAANTIRQMSEPDFLEALGVISDELDGVGAKAGATCITRVFYKHQWKRF
jgi:hypothetical protein